MSTLEKAVNLLQLMPEHKVENAYMYIRFLYSQIDSSEFIPNEKDVDSIIGIAQEYANPELLPLEKEAFANAMAEKHAIS